MQRQWEVSERTCEAVDLTDVTVEVCGGLTPVSVQSSLVERYGGILFAVIVAQLKQLARHSVSDLQASPSSAKASFLSESNNHSHTQT